MACSVMSAPSVASMPTTLVSTGRSRRTERRRSDVTAVVGGADQDRRRGTFPPTISAAMAAATFGPGRRLADVADVVDLRRPVSARASPAASAASGPQATASTVLPKPRAAVSSSSTMLSGAPSRCSASTQILSIAVIS